MLQGIGCFAFDGDSDEKNKEKLMLGHPPKRRLATARTSPFSMTIRAAPSMNA